VTHSIRELWEILVPCTRNDGRPISVRFHRVWDEKVRSLTGGLTIFHPAKGQWVSPSGELFVERMIPVRIAVTGNHMLNEIVQFTLDHYEQEAVMYYRVAETCIITARREPLKKVANPTAEQLRGTCKCEPPYFLLGAKKGICLTCGRKCDRPDHPRMFNSKDEAPPHAPECAFFGARVMKKPRCTCGALKIGLVGNELLPVKP
jgi:hypothetical protein